MSQSLAQRLLAQRQHWVETAPGKKVSFLRPRETEFGQLAGGVTAEHVCQYVTGWAGYTEADVLGPTHGANDPAPFSPELWAEYVRDRVELLSTVAHEISAVVTAHINKRAEDAKN